MVNMKVLLIAPDDKRYVVEAGKGKFSTHLGAIDLSKLKIGKIKSNTGQTFTVLPANFSDLLQHSRRGPAVVLPKDASAIIINSGLSCGDIVVDIGTGSGWLASMLGHAVGSNGKVITYEVRKEFAQLAEKNFKFLELKNVKVKLQDATKKIDEKNVDLITVDLPEPWLILKNTGKALKTGKFLVAYCPQITQVMELASNLEKHNFKLEKVIEIQEREWKVHDKVCRPQHNALTHTAFPVFSRKI
jgi:tRNA (adenine57-N1/adenine58-N1)-methyltransferase